MKVFYFLSIILLCLGAPCGATSGRPCDIEEGTLEVLVGQTFHARFIKSHAPHATHYEEVLETLFTHFSPDRREPEEGFEVYIRTWLNGRKNDAALSAWQKGALPHIDVTKITPEIQGMIFRLSFAQEQLENAFKTQWHTWVDALGSQENFCQAFLARYPEALPSQPHEFLWAISSQELGETPHETLAPHILIATNLHKSLLDFTDARHLMVYDTASHYSEDLTPAGKTQVFKDLEQLKAVRSLFFVRAFSMFEEGLQGWPLLDMLHEALPHLNDLETLQLPVLFKSEEAKAREILSACTSLKNIIISQSVGEDFDVKAPTLDPRLLFEGVPKNVSLFLRECACDISYLRQSGMLRGTLSRYDPTSQAFTQISVPTSYSQLIDVNYVLMDALVPRAQDPSLS